MIDLCLFGVSAGLQTRHMPLCNNNDSFPKTEDSWIEISTRDIIFEGDAEITMIARRQTSSHVMTWIGLYRPAREVHLNRSGGYYGAGMWLIDSAISGQVAIKLVVSLADQLRDNALLDGRFIKNVTELNLSDFKLPRHTSDILNACYSVKGLGGIIPGSATQAIITDKAKTSPILDWAQRSKTADFFGSVLIVSPERLLPVDEQAFRRTKTFNSIPDVVDFVYEHRVLALLQSNKQVADEQSKAISLAKQLASTNEQVVVEQSKAISLYEQLASQKKDAQTKISQLIQEKETIEKENLDRSREISNMKIKISCMENEIPNHNAIYPSSFLYQIRENWFLLIALSFSIVFVAFAIFVGIGAVQQHKSKQNSAENAAQNKKVVTSTVSSENTDSKNHSLMPFQSEEAPKGTNGVKTDTTQNEH